MVKLGVVTGRNESCSGLFQADSWWSSVAADAALAWQSAAPCRGMSATVSAQSHTLTPSYTRSYAFSINHSYILSLGAHLQSQ